MSSTVGSLQERAQRAGQTRFLGCPIEDFERGGRRMFELLLREGLAPSSRLLDVGCGALRLGYWAMRFLDTGHYFGIEPNVEMRELGEELVGAHAIGEAQPRFSDNDDFDFSVFGEQFDYALAGSIWTHASQQQIATMLASFAAASTPTGVFIASYRPASAVWARMLRLQPRVSREIASRLPLSELSPLIARLPSKRDYQGEGWVGRSHDSDTPGVIDHSLPWIAQEAARHGLTAELVPYRREFRHFWIRVRHSGVRHSGRSD